MVFAPAGIDVYSQMEGRLLEALFAWTREASAGIDDLGLKTLVGEIFEARGEETHRAYDVHFGGRSAIRTCASHPSLPRFSLLLMGSGPSDVFGTG